MKQYKLLKDLPGIKKGTILSEGKSLFGARTLITKNDVGPIFIGNDLTEELFEEIKEPVDSIHWKPKYDDWYFYISDHGSVCSDIWNDNYTDNKRLAFGFVYRTEEECEEALDRKLAEARLRQTSTFKPDFENGNGGWIVGYDYEDESLTTIPISDVDYGEPVRYATSEDARKSIKENREDWLIYFGVKE